MSSWTEPQNLLQSAGVVITAVYVVLTYRLLKSAESSGKETAELVEANKALVKVMQGQLQTMRDQHQFTLDVHGARAEREKKDLEDAYHTVDGHLEWLRCLTFNLQETEAQLPFYPFAWQQSAQQGYDALAMADEYRYARRGLIAAAKGTMESLERFLERLKPETQVFMLRADELEEWVEAKHSLLEILREMFEDAPPEAPQRYPNARAERLARIKARESNPQENDSTTANGNGTMKAED